MRIDNKLAYLVINSNMDLSSAGFNVCYYFLGLMNSLRITLIFHVVKNVGSDSIELENLLNCI